MINAGLPKAGKTWSVHEMSRQAVIALYVAAMVTTIVAVDVAFFRGRLLARLLANVGIVLVFLAFYLRFFAHNSN